MSERTLRPFLRLVRRPFASVRVRVAIVAGLAFAITLIGGSVLLLRTLESRLVGDIRSADKAQLRAAVQLLEGPAPSPPSGTGAPPVAGQGTVSYQLASKAPGQKVVVTRQAIDDPSQPDIADDRPQTGTATGGVPVGSTAEASANILNTVFGVSSAGAFSTQALDPNAANLYGIDPKEGPFLITSDVVSPGVAISTASSLAEVNSTLSTTRTILWYVVPALVLLVMGAAWLLVGRALRPVHSLTARAASINAHSLHERVPVSDVGDEVSELAATINSMLARIEAADLASRRLVSDASHELRTPIAVMRTELEVARRNPEAQWGAVSETVLGEVDRLQGLVDDLLLLARISERGVIAAPFSLLDTVRDVAGRRRSTDVTVELTARGDDADVEVVGDSSAVQRALDHVAANAARHAIEHVEVTLETEREDGLVAVHVDDDGPGIAKPDRERVLQRFERLDEARSRDAGGSGLGLAVAADVMVAHGGRVDIGPSPLGGARVTLLMLPGASAVAHESDGSPSGLQTVGGTKPS